MLSSRRWLIRFAEATFTSVLGRWRSLLHLGGHIAVLGCACSFPHVASPTDLIMLLRWYLWSLAYVDVRSLELGYPLTLESETERHRVYSRILGGPISAPTQIRVDAHCIAFVTRPVQSKIPQYLPKCCRLSFDSCLTLVLLLSTLA